MSLFFPPDGRVPGRDSPRPTWNPPQKPVPPRQPEHDVPVRIVAEYVLASSGRVYSRDVEPSESDSEFEREIPIEVGAAAMYSDYGTLVLTDLRLVFVNDFCASSVLSIPLAAIRSCAIAPTERLIREPKNVLVIQVHGSRFQFRFHRRDEDEPGITRFSDFIRLRLSAQTGRETNLPRSPTLQIDVTE